MSNGTRSLAGLSRRLAFILLGAFAVVLAVWLLRKLSLTDVIPDNQVFALALAFVGLGLVLVLWLVPKLQASSIGNPSADERFKTENEARKTLAQVLFGLGILATIYSSTQTLRVTQQGQITDRFTKAVGQFGETAPEKVAVRLGGIYALERITRESSRDQIPIMEILTSYIRQSSPPAVPVIHRSPDGAVPCDKVSFRPGVDAPREEVQAILTVMSRRAREQILNERQSGYRVDLAGAHLTRAGLRGANLERANLNATHLQGADLSGANLSDSFLLNTYFQGAHLDSASLEGAYMRGAFFENWDDALAICQGRILQTSLRGANLSRAMLAYARLTGADLHGARLDGANLDRADLSGADLSGADLTGTVNLTQDQLNAACLDSETKLPAKLADGRAPLSLVAWRQSRQPDSCT